MWYKLTGSNTSCILIAAIACRSYQPRSNIGPVSVSDTLCSYGWGDEAKEAVPEAQPGMD